jgi:hypothetical protein
MKILVLKVGITVAWIEKIDHENRIFKKFPWRLESFEGMKLCAQPKTM